MLQLRQDAEHNQAAALEAAQARLQLLEAQLAAVQAQAAPALRLAQVRCNNSVTNILANLEPPSQALVCAGGRGRRSLRGGGRCAAASPFLPHDWQV